MNTYRIYKNVSLGDGSTVEDFSLVGVAPRGAQDGELPTTIGERAVIRSHTVIYAGNVIGRNFQTGNKVNIRESNRIGDNVSIGTLSVVEHHDPVGRVEDARLVTGSGKYASDWKLPGQLYAHFVRSDRAHADIVSVDASPALKHPGVVAIHGSGPGRRGRTSSASGASS